MSDEKEQALKVEQQQIDDGKRVQEFLKDPAVAEILKRIEKQYLNDFRSADTDEKRRNVWACTQALTAFVDALNGALDTGKFAQHARTTRNAVEDRAAARTSRK